MICYSTVRQTAQNKRAEKAEITKAQTCNKLKQQVRKSTTLSFQQKLIESFQDYVGKKTNNSENSNLVRLSMDANL
jgi:hypothetical protein